MVKLSLFIICALLVSQPLRAVKPLVQAGLGNFDGLHAGLLHQWGKIRLIYGLGSDLNIYGQGFANSLYLGGGKQISKKVFKASDPLFLYLKTSTWNLENKSNIFTVLTFGPALNYRLHNTKKFELELYGGFTFSTVLRYKRKGYFEVGFPREWLPDFGLRFTLCKHED